MIRASETEFSNIRLQESLTQIKELHSVLSKIHFLSEEKTSHFKTKNQKIDIRMKINNKKSKDYLERTHNRIPKDPIQDELLDILSENIQIHHMKFVVVQEFIEDIYSRLETIGTSINKTLVPLSKLLEEKMED